MRRQIQVFLMGIALLSLTGCNEEVKEAVNYGNAALEKAEVVVDKGADALDKVQEIDANVTNAISTISVKVQILKNLEHEYNGQTFTLEELFDVVLEDAKWETDEIEDVEVVIVSGGLKDNILAETMIELGDEQALMDLLNETSRVRFVFPYYENQLAPDSEIAVIYEVGGEEVYSGMGGEVLKGLFEVYSQELNSESK